MSNFLAKYTVPGALATAVPRYAGKEALQLQEAIASVETGLNRYTQNGLNNPYHLLIGTDLYRVPGLSGDWTDVFSAFVSPIGAAIGGRIAPAPKVSAPPPPPPGAPAWVKIAIGGGAAIALFLIARSLLKRR